MAQNKLALASETLPAGTRLGRYEIAACIGAGGMGAVYEAIDTVIERKVALKVLHPSLVTDAAIRARFLREGEAIARIRHPNVVDVLDVGVEQGFTYLVMEHLAGESLADHLKRVGQLDEGATANLALPLLAGLMSVHAAGIIHRDLKPANVMLSRVNAGVVPKLLDFGISKVSEPLDHHLTLTKHVVLGTPSYMAPEQVRAPAAVDERTDQYAIGVMFYRCLTGKLPYSGSSLYDLMSAVVEGDCEKPSKLNATVSIEMEGVVLRAMSASRSARFPSIEELGRALLPFASERMRAQYGATFGLSSETTSPEIFAPDADDDAPTAPGEAPIADEISAAGAAPPAARSSNRWALPIAALVILVLGFGAGLFWSMHEGRFDRVEPTSIAAPVASPRPQAEVVSPIVPPPAPPPSAAVPEPPVQPGAAAAEDDAAPSTEPTPTKTRRRDPAQTNPDIRLTR